MNLFQHNMWRAIRDFERAFHCELKNMHPSIVKDLRFFLHPFTEDELVKSMQPYPMFPNESGNREFAGFAIEKNPFLEKGEIRFGFLVARRSDCRD